MKRSVNFQGSAATVRAKAQRPSALLKTFRFLGMTDAEIEKALLKMKTQAKNG